MLPFVVDPAGRAEEPPNEPAVENPEKPLLNDGEGAAFEWVLVDIFGLKSKAEPEGEALEKPLPNGVDAAGLAEAPPNEAVVEKPVKPLANESKGVAFENGPMNGLEVKSKVGAED